MYCIIFIYYYYSHINKNITNMKITQGKITSCHSNAFKTWSGSPTFIWSWRAKTSREYYDQMWIILLLIYFCKWASDGSMHDHRFAETGRQMVGINFSKSRKWFRIYRIAISKYGEKKKITVCLRCLKLFSNPKSLFFWHNYNVIFICIWIKNSD